MRVHMRACVCVCVRESDKDKGCVCVEYNILIQLPCLCFRTLWKKCCFSGDGEFIVAGSARQHSLYIWEKSVGNLVKILHGTKGELLLDVVVSGLFYMSWCYFDFVSG